MPHNERPSHPQRLSLFKDEALAKVQWLNKLNKYRAQVDHKLQKIKADLKPSSNQISELTKKRLDLMAHALQTQKKEVEFLLSSFELEKSDQSASIASVLSQRVPSTQHVLSYFANIFRDWAWPAEENKVSLELLKEVWPKTKVSELLVLGSGAGRLAYDLASNKMAEEFLLLDINPLLLSVSEKMWGAENNEITLTEINEHPQSLETLTKKWQLKPPASPAHVKSTQKVTHIWADGVNLPFKDESLGTVLTPWFIDIIPEDFFSFAKRLNSRMKDGAHWINFGPLGYGSPEKGSSYTKEEIAHNLDLAGFKLEANLEKRIIYLHSPLSSQKREETVQLWRAKKFRKMVAPKDSSIYPEWLLDTSLPIEQKPEFLRLQQDCQLELQILMSIDGKRSISDIAELMTQHLNMRQDEAENILRTFFSNQFEK